MRSISSELSLRTKRAENKNSSANTPTLVSLLSIVAIFIFVLGINWTDSRQLIFAMYTLIDIHDICTRVMSLLYETRSTDYATRPRAPAKFTLRSDSGWSAY